MAVGVFYVFILFGIANRASFLVQVCHELLFGVVIFCMHFCHVTLECPKPKHLKKWKWSFAFFNLNEIFTQEPA